MDIRSSFTADSSFAKGNAYFLGGALGEESQSVMQAAFGCYEDAALNNHPAAQCSLGIMYKYGEGVPQSDELAAAWLEQAVEGGNSSARAQLAELYHKSTVVSSIEKALLLYEELAAEGSASALYNLGNIYLYGKSSVEKSRAVSLDYFSRAARKGHIGR